jgi:prepilin peptidase CpaA
MPPVQIALWTILGVALLISVVTDVVGGRILDAVTWPAMGAALAVRLWAGGLGDLESGLLSGALSALGAMGLFALFAGRGKMDWGDVKLMGVVGAALGYPLVMAALMFISLVGVLQVVVTLLWKGQIREQWQALGRRWAIRLRLLPKDAVAQTRRHIPYGVAIALGSGWAVWWGQQAL